MKLALVLILLTGCSYLRGETRYTGSARYPELTEEVRTVPAMNAYGRLNLRWNYTKLAHLSNPYSLPIQVTVNCGLYEDTFRVPSLTSKAFLIGANVDPSTAYACHCKIANWSVAR